MQDDVKFTVLKEFSVFSHLGILSPQKPCKRSFVIVERAIQLRKKNSLASSGAVSRDYQLLILTISTKGQHLCTESCPASDCSSIGE